MTHGLKQKVLRPNDVSDIARALSKELASSEIELKSVQAVLLSAR